MRLCCPSFWTGLGLPCQQHCSQPSSRTSLQVLPLSIYFTIYLFKEIKSVCGSLRLGSLRFWCKSSDVDLTAFSKDRGLVCVWGGHFRSTPGRIPGSRKLLRLLDAVCCWFFCHRCGLASSTCMLSLLDVLEILVVSEMQMTQVSMGSALLTV